MLELAKEQRVVLAPCSWETYERILSDQLDQSVPRFAYSDGRLEIVSPSPEHERACEVLKQVVYVACDHLDREVEGLGSATIRRQGLGKGMEADAWFFIDRFGVDPAVEAPDLAIEVEVSQSALDKLPILEAIEVPELWRTDLARVRIFRLREGSYREVERSEILPLSAENLALLLNLRATVSRKAWTKRLRELLGG